MVELSDLSKTGGLANAYEAAILADKMSSTNKAAAVSKPTRQTKIKVKAKEPVKKAF
jgi:hypothetical protein